MNQAASLRWKGGSAQYKPPAYADEHNAEFLGLNIGPSRYDCDGVTFLYPGWEND